MARFGRRSNEKLDTIDLRLATVLRAVIQHTDFTVLTGRRGRAAQEEARSTGKSKAGWPDSAHNCPLHQDGCPKEQWPEDSEMLSRAVDVAPWPIDWNDTKAFSLLAGRILQEAGHHGLSLRWGGDWDGDGKTRDNRFNDLPHFEIKRDGVG